jgi:prepilin-type N-terminal cleavage/methylation domain-containing protein
MGGITGRRGGRVRGARSAGFSLLEVLVAMTILMAGAAALAPLAAISSRVNAGAQTMTMAALLAQEKMEQLRGVEWSADALGVPISDTTTDVTVMPEAAAGGTGLRSSPPRALGRNTPGYCDFVDARGRSLGGGPDPPAGVLYVRRWSVELLPTITGTTIVLQVRVNRWRSAGPADAAAAGRAPDEARLVTLKTRRAP